MSDWLERFHEPMKKTERIVARKPVTPWPEQPVSEQVMSQIELGIDQQLQPVLSISSENPHVKELQGYAQGTQEKFAFLRTSQGMGRALAEVMISRIPSKDRRLAFQNMAYRLRRETSYLSALEQTGIASALVEGMKEGTFVAPVRFEVRGRVAKRMRDEGYEATYHPLLGKVFLPDPPPSPESMWTQLVSEGNLPEVIDKLHHELTHSFEVTGKDRLLLASRILVTLMPSASLLAVSQMTSDTRKQLVGILGAIGVQVGALFKVAPDIAKTFRGLEEAMWEVHANEAVISSPTISAKETTNKETVVNELRENYDFDYTDPGESWLAIAYEKIHELRLLGFSDRQIAEITKGASIDYTQATFPKLQDKIDETLEKKWGVTKEEDKELVLNALRAKHELELYVQRHRAQQIAIEELRKEAMM